MSTVKADNFTWRNGEATAQVSPTITGEQLVRGVAKTWVNFNGTGTVAIRTSFNVSSLTDNGTGDYTVNFTSVLLDGNYCSCVNSGNAGGTGLGAWTVAVSVASSTSSSLRIGGYSSAGGVQDQDQVMAAIFR